MKVCTYCGSEINSTDFCSAAHKMAFRRGQKLLFTKIPKNQKTKRIERERAFAHLAEQLNQLPMPKMPICKHGNPKALCKQCITKK